MRVNTDTQRRQHRALRVTAVVIMALALLMGGMAGTAAAQDSEPVAPCEDGPPVPGQGSSNDSETGTGDIEVAFVTDRSASMDGDRMQNAKNASKLFTDDLGPDDEAAVVSWADQVTLDQELTSDKQAVKDAIDGITPDQIGGNLDGGVNTGTDELINGTNATVNATKVMLVVTDAESGNFDEQAAIDASEDAKAQGITVYTIGVGGSVDAQLLTQMASGDRYYNGSDPDDLEQIYQEISGDVEAIGGDLRVDTRALYQPNSTHPYEITKVTYYDNGSTEREDVTANASVSTTNTTLLSVNDANNTLSATDDANVSTWVRVDATHAGADGCTNVIVAAATVENLELLPNNTWRFAALFFESDGGLNFLFILLIATLFAVPMARFTSAFGGLAVAEMVLVIGWFAGYVSFGMAAVSVFVALFIGLNLAANIDYQAGSLRQ